MNPGTLNAPGNLVSGEMRLDPLRVLVVDDDPDIQDLLQSCLVREGFDVQAVGNGLSAVDLFGQWRPAIVLMDRQMPLMDGVEAARRMRASETAAGAPRAAIVSISGSVLPSEESLLRHVGFDSFLPKPFRMADLQALLARLTERSRP